MKIALVQQHASNDGNDNISRGISALEEAASKGAQLIAYPELAFTRFYPQKPSAAKYKDLAETVPGPTTDKLREKAKKLGVVVVINLFEKEKGKTYDSSQVIDADGRIVGKTRMAHILEAPCFHEKEYYSPGNLRIRAFETEVGRIGIAICYDRHFPEYMRMLALGGAELVVIPQAGAVNEWTPGLFEAEIQTASFQNGYYAALVNRVGVEERVTFAGESFVTDPSGKVVARAKKLKDQILYCDVDLRLIRRSFARKHFINDRRPQLYRGLTKRSLGLS